MLNKHSSLLREQLFFSTFNRRPPEVEETSSKAKYIITCRGSHEFTVLMAMETNSRGNINYQYKAFSCVCDFPEDFT